MAATLPELQPPASNKPLPSAIRRLWRDYRLFITGLLAVASLILGYVGFSMQEQSWSVSDRLYASVELFRLYVASAKPTSNMYLLVAQWLAPATVAYTAFLGLAEIFKHQITVWRINHFTRDHVVICGLGRCGIRLATSFRKGGSGQDPRSVVVIDRNPTVAETRICRELGISVLIGDARDPTLLDQAGLQRAAYLIAVCGNDAIDAEVASAALSASVTRVTRTSLRCFIHIGDDRLTEQLEQLSLEQINKRQGPRAQLELFNVYGLAPKALLDTDPKLLDPIDGRSPHVLVIGVGVLGRKLVVEAARRWSLGQHPTRIRITAVTHDAERVCVDLKSEFPDLEKVCDLQPVVVDAADIRGDRPMKIDLPSSHSQTKAFVCVEDDDACLRATIQTRETLATDISVVACTTGSSALARFLRTGSGVLEGVQEFALLEIALTPEILLDTINERVAQALHSDYYTSRTQHPDPEDQSVRAMVPWAQLPEHLKHSNRAKASSIGAQLKGLNFKLVRNDAWRAPSRVFTDVQVEELAKREHLRWRASKEADGWRYNPRRDDKKKLNPYLVEWSDLSDGIQEIDRSFARALPRILAAAGYAIQNKTG